MGIMGRLSRATEDGLVRHAMNRGNNRADVFAVDADHKSFLESLCIAKGHYPFAGSNPTGPMVIPARSAWFSSSPVFSRVVQENSRGYTEIPREDVDMPASQPSLLLEQFRDC